MMKQIARFEPNHDDLIHCLNYDFYGTKLASCSTDQKIKIFGYNQTKLTWNLLDSWKAHEATILKVCWAHPEFGTIIASCSADRTVRIFEDTLVETSYNTLSGTTSNKRWLERAKLIESRAPVMDVQFAPAHLGLKLATISCDGYVRIYEAMDIINLNNWSLMEEIPIENMINKEGFQEGLCLSWCPTKFVPAQIAIGCGSENTVKILRNDSTTNGKFVFKERLLEHEGPIHSISWAPNFGKSFELIATGCKDTKVRIFKLSDTNMFNSSNSEMNLNYEVDLLATFSDHNMEVWKVEFNILGTILASSGDDGRVLLYKASHGVDWKCMSIISSDTNQNSNSSLQSLSQNNFDPSND